MAEEKTLLAWPVRFRDTGATIRINGQEINQANLTQDSYEYLLAFNKNYALQFVSAEEKEAAKPLKKTPDGKKTES